MSEQPPDKQSQADPIEPTLKIEPLSPVDDAPRIRGYKLLEKIGEGGCGVVYLAQQEIPVRRRVALKVIKPGMDTKEVLARFEAEKQALAMMDHPNIARVFDGGSTENGHPFFVMELVKGTRLTAYCDQNELPTRERLELFERVCRAIQHAHQKGIIHRDIKPSNILVADHDGAPVPKVIDFGIAKAIDQQLTNKTLFTELGQFIGTPAYMSPEQARLTGIDIDTRSDIYSLGVLLYELLTGRTPFGSKRLRQAGFEEILRIIREEEPPRPSTRLSNLNVQEQTTVAKRRHVELPKLLSIIRGDLDWIVMKALEKDRRRRYDTVNAFADDIRRHLQDEPVAARPPSTAYRLGKFVRKHRAKIATSLAMVFVAVAASLSIFLLVREPRGSRYGAVEIKSFPPGAEVWREGMQVGVTPFSVGNVVPGAFNFSLKLTNHETIETDMTVAKRERASLLVFMKSKPVESRNLPSFSPQNPSPPINPSLTGNPVVAVEPIIPAKTNVSVASARPPTYEIFELRTSAATVTQMQGPVEVAPSNSIKWGPAQVGMGLSHGDQLRTGQKSSATIRMRDGSQIRVAALTIFTLSTNAVNLKEGQIFLRNAPGAKPIEINTPHVKAEVRG